METLQEIKLASSGIVVKTLQEINLVVSTGIVVLSKLKVIILVFSGIVVKSAHLKVDQ